jgi:hypothetical protein
MLAQSSKLKAQSKTKKIKAQSSKLKAKLKNKKEAQSSKLNAQCETKKQKEVQSQDFLFEIELINPFNIEAISLPSASILEYCPPETHFFRLKISSNVIVS